MVLRLMCMCTYCVWQTRCAMHLSLSRNEEFLSLEHKWQLYFEAKEDEAKTRGRVHRTWYVQTLARLSMPMSCVNSSRTNSYHKNKAKKGHKGNSFFFSVNFGDQVCVFLQIVFVVVCGVGAISFGPVQSLTVRQSVSTQISILCFRCSACFSTSQCVSGYFSTRL